MVSPFSTAFRSLETITEQQLLGKFLNALTPRLFSNFNLQQICIRISIPRYKEHSFGLRMLDSDDLMPSATSVRVELWKETSYCDYEWARDLCHAELFALDKQGRLAVILDESEMT